MINQESLASKLSDNNIALLAALSDEQLTSLVIEFLDATSSGDSFIDFDRLMGTGITLAKLQRIQLSNSVVQWLLKEVTSRRVDVACALLSGLWHPNFCKNKIDQGSVRRIADDLDLTGLAVDPMCSYTFALFQSSRSEISPETKGALSRAADKIKAYFSTEQMPNEIEIQLKKIYEAAA